MNLQIKQTFSLLLAFFMLFSFENHGKNNPLYLLILEKIAQKNDLNSTLVDIASIINKHSDEKINTVNIKEFITSDAGKALKESYQRALHPDRNVQQPLSAVGLFLYDFYQLNLFDDQTIEIGKIFELYLCSLYSIPTSLQLEKVVTPADLVKKHRFLYNEETIQNTLAMLKNLISLIQTTPLEKLQDALFVENELLPKLGLNDANLHEFPSHLKDFYGKGFRYWGYPAQFAQFLVSLSKHSIKNYLEISALGRGTFIIITEYLKRFNPSMSSYAVDTHYSLITDLYCNEINQNTEYILDFSNSKRFIDIQKTQWDLTFIDGYRSFQDITGLYNLIKNNANIMVLQDISSDPCPGIGSLWNILKKVYYKKNKIDEFTQQYEEVTKRQNQKYMGLGVVYKNILK